MPKPTTITTEDNVVLKAGDLAYDYYTMKPGTIAPQNTWAMMPDAWFDFYHTDGTRALLNGQRICSIEYARTRGFKGA